MAIAISLLILPVVGSVADGRTSSATDLLGDNGDRLFAFVLSFVVIAWLWITHHRMFETVTGYSPAILWANMLWLISIVSLPLPTELLGVRGADEVFVRFLYIAAMLVSSAALLLIQWLIARAPELWRDPDVHPRLDHAIVTPALLVLALVVAAAVPWIGMWAMLVLALTGPIISLIDAHRA